MCLILYPSVNRTIVELKRNGRLHETKREVAVNRTIVELKPNGTLYVCRTLICC